MGFCFWRRRKGFVRISDKYIPKENSPLFLYQVLSLLPKAWLMLFYIRCLGVWSVDRKCAYLHFLSNCKVSAKYILKLVYSLWLMMKNFSVVSVKHCVSVIEVNDLGSLLTLPWARHFYISTVIINVYVVHTVMTSDSHIWTIISSRINLVYDQKPAEIKKLSNHSNRQKRSNEVLKTILSQCSCTSPLLDL